MKINFTGTVPVAHEDIMRNVEHARSTGLPYIEPCQAHSRALAIVGGGPSIIDRLEEIRSFDGDIWAVNGACAFLRSHGIDSTLFGVDPHHIVRTWAPGAKKALLCSRTDYQVWDILKGADIRLFDLVQENTESGITSGSSTATCAFDLGSTLGYRKIVFFGCEGSYPGMAEDNANDTTHAYSKELREERLLVKCGDKEYLTAPDFFVQCQEISMMLKAFPMHIMERSGGLLRAMAENDDYDIIKVSRKMMEGLTFSKAEPCQS